MTQAQKLRSQDFLFTAVRASAEKYGAIRGVNRPVPQRHRYNLALCLNVRIVLDAASALDFAALHSNSLPSIGLRRILYAKQIEKPEYRCEEKPEPSVSALRSR